VLIEIPSAAARCGLRCRATGTVRRGRNDQLYRGDMPRSPPEVGALQFAEHLFPARGCAGPKSPHAFVASNLTAPRNLMRQPVFPGGERGASFLPRTSYRGSPRVIVMIIPKHLETAPRGQFRTGAARRCQRHAHDGRAGGRGQGFNISWTMDGRSETPFSVISHTAGKPMDGVISFETRECAARRQ